VVTRMMAVLRSELARLGLGHLVEHELYARMAAECDAWRQHHMGTTRMHADPARGVVDANCRVHGIEQSAHCGSSVSRRVAMQIQP